MANLSRSVYSTVDYVGGPSFRGEPSSRTFCQNGTRYFDLFDLFPCAQCDQISD
ncbi:Uncharacterised protein [Vibrio cholerae]|nr:Uncharacterised protein [Vibrio cholerae]